MFSQGVLGRTVCSGAIPAGNLLREAAVCPVAASEPLNCNLLVLQGHGQPPTGNNTAGDNWQQTGPCVEQSHLSLQRRITRCFRDRLRLCGPMEPWLPPQIPQPSVPPGEGSARSSPCSPPCQLIAASGLRPAARCKLQWVKNVKHPIQSVNLPLSACMFPGNKQLEMLSKEIGRAHV